MSINRKAWTAVALGTALCLATVFSEGPRATDSALVPAGPPPDLFLVYTGDVIGYVDPCG